MSIFAINKNQFVLKALAGILTPLLAACGLFGGGGDEPIGAQHPSPVVTSSTAVSEPTPAATPTQSPAVLPTAPAEKPAAAPELVFATDLLALEYTADWRISNRTEDSVTYTLKERPGEVLFSVQWTPGSTPDSLDAFAERLELLAAEVVRLEDIRFGGQAARRYLSLFLGGNEASSMVLNVIAHVQGTTYLVTFAASPDLFQEYAGKAEDFITRLRVP